MMCLNMYSQIFSYMSMSLCIRISCDVTGRQSGDKGTEVEREERPYYLCRGLSTICVLVFGFSFDLLNFSVNNREHADKKKE